MYIHQTHLCSFDSTLSYISVLVIENEDMQIIVIGLVQGWAAIVMGVLSGSVPWFTMMVVHKKWWLLQSIDDTLGVFHTHAVAGYLRRARPLLPLLARHQLPRRRPGPQAGRWRRVRHRLERRRHLHYLRRDRPRHPVAHARGGAAHRRRRRAR